MIFHDNLSKQNNINHSLKKSAFGKLYSHLERTGKKEFDNKIYQKSVVAHICKIGGFLENEIISEKNYSTAYEYASKFLGTDFTQSSMLFDNEIFDFYNLEDFTKLIYEIFIDLCSDEESIPEFFIRSQINISSLSYRK